MSFDLAMTRFGESAERAAKQPSIEDMLREARSAMPTDDSTYDIASEDPDGFGVVLAAGTGDVHADHAVFQLQSLDETDLRVLHAIAKAGDMVVIVEGGHYPAILTDLKQRTNLPSDWIAKNEPTPVATTPKQLGQLIRGAFDDAEAYRQKVIGLHNQYGPADPSPWNSADPEYRIVYVQALRGENYNKQSNKLCRFSAKEREGGSLPVEGGPSGCCWIVTLPSGEILYSYSCRFFDKGWDRFFKAFAAEGTRLTGTIEGKRFVCSDGRSFSLDQCITKRLMTDDD